MRGTKITCRPRNRRESGYQSDCVKHVHWRKAAPFVVNPRGLLVHRTNSVQTLRGWGRIWHHADYLCGNGANIKDAAAASAFVFDVPKGRLVCVRCEQVAESLGLPSASELCGRHVCVGRIRAQRLCCLDDHS